MSLNITENKLASFACPHSVLLTCLQPIFGHEPHITCHSLSVSLFFLTFSSVIFIIFFFPCTVPLLWPKWHVSELYVQQDISYQNLRH